MSGTRLLVALVGAWVVTAAGACWAGEWQNIGPGGGGWVPSVAVSPVDSNVVYAGCDVGGFYRSTDAGGRWEICNEGLRDYYVEVIAPHPSDARVIYVGTEGGVHRSDDGGRTWRLLSEGFPPRQRWSFSAPIGALAIDPRKPEVVYAGIGRPRWGKGGVGAVYRTRDGGAHWVLANPDGGGMDRHAIVRELVVQPVSGAIFAATDRGLYVSEDEGVRWRQTGRGLASASIGRVALCRSRPKAMYVSVISPGGQSPRRGGVWRSDDGGRTWRDCSGGLGDRVGKAGEPGEMTSNVDKIVVDPEDPDVAFVGDVSWVTAGVYGTSDGGKNWKNLTQSLDRGWIRDWGPSVMGLAMDPRRPDCVYFSTSGHVFRTTDRGAHWEPIYTRRVSGPQVGAAAEAGWWTGNGLETTCLTDIVIGPEREGHLYLCYMDLGLIQSLDGGKSFAQTVGGMRYRGNTFTVAFDPEDARIVYAGAGEWGANHGDVCKSEDAGTTWRVVGKPETGLPDGQTYRLVVDRSSPKDARRIFVSVNGAGVFCSEDGGASWRARNAGLGGGGKAVRDLVAHPTKGGTLFALLGESEGDVGGVYRSDDAGKTWGRLSGEMAWPEGKCLVVCPSDPRRMYIGARESQVAGRTYSGGVFASSDAGATWRRVLEDPFIQAIAVDPTDADVVYAGGNDHPFHDDAVGLGVVCSRDGGKTWSTLNDPSLTSRKITALKVDPHRRTRIYATTGGNGVFVREVNVGRGAGSQPATTPSAATSGTSAASGLSGPFRWVSTGAIIRGRRDARHAINAIKDPTVVRYNGRWHVYASSVTDRGEYGMVYLSFADWKDAAEAPHYYMDENPNLRGYHCAPQVFYFAPQGLWYLVYQSQQPTYSTTTDLSKPETWSRPESFFAGTPKTVVNGWLDYWVICDETHAYLFFTDDHGRFYRSRTTLAEFPKGFGDPVVVMQEAVGRELFEAGCTYRIKGTGQYLTLIEAGSGRWQRYFKAFVADRLDGEWRPLAATWGESFADMTQVRFEDGAGPWTNDISHGELIRDGYDQMMTIDPANLVLLYQGVRPEGARGKKYNEIPWELGMLRRE